MKKILLNMENTKLTSLIPVSLSQNYEDYLIKMSYNIDDKIDYLLENKDKFNIIIDIGCANGALLFILKKQIPGLVCIGYDIDKQLIEIAKKNSTYSDFNIYFTDNKEELLEIIKNLRIKFENPKIIVNMCSILHEVFSYCNQEQQTDFMKLIQNLKPDYISIRDFYLDDKTKSEKSDPIFSKKVEKYFSKIIPTQPKIMSFGKNLLASWEALYKKINEYNSSLLHFLLKLKSLKQSNDIMEREFFENYLSLTDDKIQAFKTLNSEAYEVSFEERYSTKGFEERTMAEIGVPKEQIDNLPKTKIKLLLEKRENKPSPSNKLCK